MLKTVTIFLTPNKENPSEAVVAAFPETVRLFIDVEIDNGGNQTVTNIDEVIWQYSKEPPPESGLAPFPGAPDPIDINAEVRLAPENSPFGSSPAGGSFNSLLPAPETESYENIGVNPLVPNQPRLDSAPELTEPLGFRAAAAAATPVEGPPREYEYAVILTSRTNVNVLDPKIIIIRRYRRTSL
jgi:hypothetical protein